MNSIMNTLKKILAFFLPLLIPLVLVHADDAQTFANPFQYNSGATQTIPDLLLALVDLVFLIGTPIIVIFIIYAGFLFVTAGDNESKITKARFVLMWTLIGGLVLLGAKAIGLAIQNTITSLK